VSQTIPIPVGLTMADHDYPPRQRMSLFGVPAPTGSDLTPLQNPAGWSTHGRSCTSAIGDADHH